MAKISRQRGIRFEREIAKLFRRWIPEAKRGMQYQQGVYAPDVWAEPYWIECKYRTSEPSRNQLHTWMNRAIEESLWFRQDECDPILVWRVARQPIMVMSLTGNHSKRNIETWQEFSDRMDIEHRVSDE